MRKSVRGQSSGRWDTRLQAVKAEQAAWPPRPGVSFPLASVSPSLLIPTLHLTVAFFIFSPGRNKKKERKKREKQEILEVVHLCTPLVLQSAPRTTVTRAPNAFLFRLNLYTNSLVQGQTDSNTKAGQSS